jgi:peroxiredoxin Q/BCP
MKTRLEPGTPAPDFTAPLQNGTSLTLSDLRGQRVALYFYPKDDTPGCTRQACSLRDGYADLQAAGVTVLGVSSDDAASHERFAQKHDLPFPLVVDNDNTIAQSYGIYGERTLYGRKVVGVQRTTFLIDEQGTIADVVKRPKVDEHAEEILRRWEKLDAAA